MAVTNGNGTTNPVVVDANRNIKNIAFGSNSTGIFTIGTTGGNSLLLSAGGNITNTTGSLAVVNAPLIFEGSTYSFLTNSGSGAAVLTFGGGISTASAATTLTIGNTSGSANLNNSNDLITGAISTGISLVTAQDTWSLTANNTYTGTTLVSGSATALNVNGAAGQLSGTTALTVNSGGKFNLGDAANGLANRVNTAATLALGGSATSTSTSANGTFTIFRGAATANSQSLVSLAVNSGSNSVTNNGTTGGVPTLTFSGATPYTRSTGGFVNLNDASMTITFTNAPTGANGLLVGAYKQGNDFLKAQAGNLAAATYTTTTTAGNTAANYTTNSNIDVNSNPTVTGAVSINSLRFNNGTAYTLTLQGINSINSAGILEGSSASTNSTITGGTIQPATAGGELLTYLNGKNLFINSTIGDNTSASSLSEGGSGILLLTGTNTYTGTTTVAGGTLQIGNGTATGDLGGSSGVTVLPGTTLSFKRSNVYSYTNAISGSNTTSGTVTQAGAGALTLGSISNVGTIIANVGTGGLSTGSVTGIGTVTNNTTTGAAGAVTLNQVGTGLTVGTVNGASGSVVNFSGDGTGSTTIANVLNTGGQLVKVTNGTVTLGAGRNTASNIEVDGGILSINSDRFGTTGSAATQTLTITGGTVSVPASNGFGAVVLGQRCNRGRRQQL